MQTSITDLKQSHLEALASDMVEKTSEVFTPNDFYGNASILKKYCGLAPDSQIPAVLPHGVSINHSTWQVELDAPLPRIYAISEEQRSKYSMVTDKALHVIGSVMHYAARMISDEVDELRSTAEGTVAFPAHSTHHLTAEFDQDAFIQSLRELPEEMQPVRVCLYWRDIQLNRHQKYLNEGFECLTAGHMFDHDFHFRLVRILASHRHCVTNSMGTSSLLATSMGLKAYLIDQELGVEGSSHFLAEYAPKITQPSAVNLLETMKIPPGQDRMHQQVWGDIATGREFVHTPEQLRALILEHSRPASRVQHKGQVPRSWGQEIQRLKTTAFEGLSFRERVIVPEGNAFHYFSAISLIEDYESWETKGVFPDLSTCESPVIVDCGSGTGYTSIQLAEMYPNAQVYGFEANPKKVKCQFRNLGTMGVSNVILNQKAVWSETGLVSFQTSNDHESPEIHQVASLRLKSFLQDGKLDLLRLNIANATLPVVQDCGGDLRSARHLVLTLTNVEAERTDFILLLAELSVIGFHVQVKRLNLVEPSEKDLQIVVTAQLVK